MNDCVFCKLVSNQIFCAKIWEDEKFMAFLDINPNTKGMTVVIPKSHFDSYAIDMPDNIYGEFFLSAKKVARILEKGLDTKRVAIVMEGLMINHAHIKLYPIHGLEEKFAEILSDERIFFNKYVGYISTKLGPEAKLKDLETLANEIKEKNNA